MNTTTTVAVARRYWETLVPQDPTNPTVDQFLNALNVGVERLTESGKWKGALMNLVMNPVINTPGTLSNGSDGYIVLPRRFASVLSMRFGCVPAPTFGQFHEYVESGPGFLDPNRPTVGILVDDGDGWPSQKVIPPGTTASLQVGITNIADAGKTVRIFGDGADGTTIYDSTAMGYNLTTAFPLSAPNGQQVSILRGLQGPLVTDPPTYFVGSWSLWMNQNGKLTQIGEYESTENVPCNHRYKCGGILNAPTQQPFSISVLGQRRYVPLIAETDFVEPGTLNALKYIILCGNHDLALRYDKAQAAEDMAVKMLNAATRTMRGGAQVDAQQTSGGACGWGYYGSGPLPNIL